MSTKFLFPEMDEFSRRFNRDYWDTIRRASDIMASIDQSALTVDQYFRNTNILPTSALMETVERIGRISQSIPDTLASTLLEYNRIVDRINQSILPAARDIQLMQDKWQVALQPVLETINRITPTEYQLLGLARTLQEQVVDLGETEIEEEPPIDDKDEEVAADAVNEILADPENWEKTLVDKLTEAKKQHPVCAWLIVNTLRMIIGIIIATIAGLLVETIKPALLRESPSQSAPIVINIDASKKMTIINEVPYYYQAIYTDPETGIKHTGWISKRSTKQADILDEGD